MPTLTRSSFDWDRDSAFSRRAAAMKPSAIREFLKLLDEPGMISFAGGIPAPELFPTDAIAESAARITADPAMCRGVLQYAASEGHAPLREWIAGYMAQVGVPCTSDNIVITSGSQQGLDLLGKLFLNPGDTMLVTAPTYLGALQAFGVYEPVFATIDPEAAMPHRGRTAPKLAYVIPDFANPTGLSVSREHREHLLDTLAELDAPVIEDAAYQALRFDGEPIPPLLALDVARAGHIDRSRVIYAGTFSKTIAPGLRVGWICAARAVIHKVVLARQASDLHGAMLDQAILHDVIASRFGEQIQRLIPVYRHRRDVMLGALERFMPEGTTWTRPDGGMFIWLTLPEGLDSRVLLRDSVETERIIFVPGTSFFSDDSGERHIRLNYTRANDATILDGIERLARLITSHAEEAACRAESQQVLAEIAL